jgi:hypothetical protein
VSYPPCASGSSYIVEIYRCRLPVRALSFVDSCRVSGVVVYGEYTESVLPLPLTRLFGE